MVPSKQAGWRCADGLSVGVPVPCSCTHLVVVGLMFFSSYQAGAAAALLPPAPLLLPSGPGRQTHLPLAETRQEGSEAGRPRTEGSSGAHQRVLTFSGTPGPQAAVSADMEQCNHNTTTHACTHIYTRTAPPWDRVLTAPPNTRPSALAS